MTRAAITDAVPSHARQVCQRLRECGQQAYLVGGCVRDALLGREVSDWDVATDARPEQVIAAFRRTVPTGIAHGTVTVLIGGVGVEVTTFRGEGAYSDGRRPDEVTFGVPLQEDLARRDFVVNAMAYDPVDGALIDPFGGQADLAARVLRAVGQAEERFAEDGLRVMRAVRFVATLGFALHPDTEAAIPGALAALARVSVERVRVELFKLLAAEAAASGLAAAERTGVLAAVLPERTQPLEVVDRLPPDPVLRLAALVSPAAGGGARALGRRLKLSNKDLSRLAALLAAPAPTRAANWSDAEVRRYASRCGRERVLDAVALHGAVGAVDLDPVRERVAAALASGAPLEQGELAIDGDGLMVSLGLPPGRRIGELLAALLERTLDDPAENRPDRLRALAAEIQAGLDRQQT